MQPSDLSGFFSSGDSKSLELDAWQAIAKALRGLDSAAQARVLKSVTTLLEIDIGRASSQSSAHLQPVTPSRTEPSISSAFSGSDDRTLSPKEFLHQKRPTTDVDKVACLAYYITHYRNTPHFKTVDLSQLNTEAAQTKFSNAAQSIDNASKKGLLVPAIKGHKQLSAAGELYVKELPDKAAARAAIEGYRRKRPRRTNNGNTKSDDNSDQQ